MRSLFALTPLLGLAFLVTTACVGSGVPSRAAHPADRGAPATPLPTVALSLTTEDAVAAPDPSPHAGHGAHHHHGGAPHAQ